MFTPIHLPFGTSIEFLDPLERNPYLTCASPIRETDEVSTALHGMLAGDVAARDAVVAEARRLGLRGDANAVLRQLASELGRGQWGLGTAREVLGPVEPDPGPGPEDFDPRDVEAWSVFSLEWSTSEGRSGERVEARAGVVGVPDGVLAHVEVYEKRRDGASPRAAGRAAARIQSGRITAAWDVEYPGDRAAIVPARELPLGVPFEAPQFYFTVSVRGRTFGEGQASGASGLLTMLDDLEIELLDVDASPLVNRAYRALLADDSVREGTVGANGRIRLVGIPPGPIEIELDRYCEEY